jgi:hypothetical protein
MAACQVLSEPFGHANPAFTIQTYQYVLAGMEADAARLFGESVPVEAGPRR